MVAQCRPLLDVLAEIPDCRTARGNRHPLTAALALGCAAILGGVRRDGAVAPWARDSDRELSVARGFPQPPPPGAATLPRILAHGATAPSRRGPRASWPVGRPRAPSRRRSRATARRCAAVNAKEWPMGICSRP